MTQYANIARQYAESQDKRLLRRYITDPSLYSCIGNLSGLEVLDLACGDGRLSRQFKLRGAKRVVGVDAEAAMIDLALEKERKTKLGVEYHVKKVGEMEKLGEFDLVVPGFLLHYAETREELLRMCQDIYRNLKQGGRMIGINQNPDCPRNPHRKYGSIVRPVKEPLLEGGIVRVTLWDNDEKTASFTNTHWNKSTYEKLLKEAGFNNIEWINMQVSEEGIMEFGREFWQDWLNSPSLTILKARKV